MMSRMICKVNANSLSFWEVQTANLVLGSNRTPHSMIKAVKYVGVMRVKVDSTYQCFCGQRK